MREVLSIGILDEASFFAQSVVFLVIWTIATGAIIFMSWKKRDTNSGLALMYAISLALVHFIVDLVYFINPKQFANDKWMFYGFKESTYGIIFFAIGNLILAPFILNLINLPIAQGGSVATAIPAYQKIFAKKYFNIGLISFFILPIFLFDIPTVQALVSAAQQLLVVGICLMCWIAWKENNKQQLRRWLLVSLFFPVITVLVHGFLGFGTTMTMVILFFIVRFFKLSLKTIIVGFILAYLGLSVYLSYMRDRGVIRSSLSAGATFVERIYAARNIVLQPEWFNPVNLSHLEAIDSRLNQNVLVGAAVENLSTGRVEFSYGKSITDSFFALIPRIFWREKFLLAGASNIVSQYTGIEFMADTSVGVGQVMEFYINFGRLGVILGFSILGVLIAFIDRKAGYYLSKGEIYKFVIWFLPGLAILLGGASFSEIAASAGANIVVARLVTSRYSNLLYIFLVTAVIFALINRMIGGG
jgi:hypothetical protein